MKSQKILMALSLRQTESLTSMRERLPSRHLSLQMRNHLQVNGPLLNNPMRPQSTNSQFRKFLVRQQGWQTWNDQKCMQAELKKVRRRNTLTICRVLIPNKCPPRQHDLLATMWTNFLEQKEFSVSAGQKEQRLRTGRTRRLGLETEKPKVFWIKTSVNLRGRRILE